jgi:hypothetical protein
MNKRSFTLVMLSCLVSVAACAGDAPAVQTQFYSAEVVGGDPASAEPNLEEDYNYPNADQLRASGITLKRGDGHLLYIDCGFDHALKVETSTPPTYDFCFALSGKEAYLSLELPPIIGIDATNHEVEATIVWAGTPKVVKLVDDFNTGYDKNNNQGRLTELRLRAP